MIILGINDTHDSSACLIKNGYLIGAIQEERIARIKNIGGFPGNSIKTLLKSNDIKFKDIDIVAVANTNPVHLHFWNIHSEFSVEEHLKLHMDAYYKYIIDVNNMFYIIRQNIVNNISYYDFLKQENDTFIF